MSKDLNSVLQRGIDILVIAKPEIGLALKLIMSLSQNWHENIETKTVVQAIEAGITEHINALAFKNLHELERKEIEIRLHELLKLLIKLGEL